MSETFRVRDDPGHASPLPTGGTDPGAVGNGVQEAECVLEIGKLLAAMLRANGVAVDMTRTGVPGPSADERAKHLEQPGVACSVSLHANSHASLADGGEIFVSAFNPESRRLGELIAREWPSWVHGIGLRSPAVRTRLAGDGEHDYYYFIRSPQKVGIPAVLVEVGFVSNPEDAKVLASFWGRFQIAYAVSRGILRFLGVDPGEQVTELQRELASANLDLADARARLSETAVLASKIAILASEKGGVDL